ncbi:MAG: M48 family metallopeptidase [Planctomycetota bacterium]|jgi:Zn-dependent protease with chaperone function
MSVVLAILAVAIVALALFLAGGRWVSTRVRLDEARSDRILRRASKRCGLILLLLVVVLIGGTFFVRHRLGPVRSALIFYLLPLLWLWTAVLGSSWLQIKARGLDVGLLRFHRFDLFISYLQIGQRLPFLSAAMAASADLGRGSRLIPEIALHFAIALLLGYLGRRLVVHHLMELEPFPDETLLGEVEGVARERGVRLRGARIVPTEGGQSVNALACTSSRVIYVAEGLYRGLDHDGVKAVLLHELGHFEQRFTNSIRNMAVLGSPAAFWAVRSTLESGLPPGLAVRYAAVIVVLWLAGILLTRSLYHQAEHRADRFAERHGTRGALALALRGMYERNRMDDTEKSAQHPALRERLRLLEDAR